MQAMARCVGFIEAKTPRSEGAKLRREPLGAIILRDWLEITSFLF